MNPFYLKICTCINFGETNNKNNNFLLFPNYPLPLNSGSTGLWPTPHVALWLDTRSAPSATWHRHIDPRHDAMLTIVQLLIATWRLPSDLCHVAQSDAVWRLARHSSSVAAMCHDLIRRLAATSARWRSLHVATRPGPAATCREVANSLWVNLVQLPLAS